MRVSKDKVNSVLEEELAKSFLQLISDLKSAEESEIFLRDFLTKSEFSALTKRLAVAYWLKKKRSYKNIKDNIKVSSATIADVQTKIKSSGYQLALKKIEAEEWANKWSEKIKRFVK
ncbi:hypothetical protein A3D00_00505 [Candidatus Woesebacteria bacterium RIFCSPHIGHO2_02_FULL_38_9]|uniref:TrpR-related protein YerC/YecD n=1 Tax=Candidatus Woesebacteria bacterium RIFCSPHIGHO2_01_FULL_39_28 TaxID=1802496 RepID=A0A1F7YJH0_9BACT|nr:MAG: hypothetical protein A2627_04195 [Candidatus Woesebacteria bacterium RIFCSPHIGHO2_01_FULL_39_28]OGM33212.1 MAG: hypothetical protein A3D00_00505 [Candidatus Woesebacteria bacterium RIFCSPHIGHO2_02_FULL_38_9]OGM58696.1 MAG: hypothetical protein A3A50_02850 [Candidatus Woesebacteria bacterium RIFCSPLOWO2_01_FULL_38_20]